uniref:C2H2-type domain-containing protein n=1 Tax=Haemonchus contortus TaxID=6289 RepID=A0A7I4Y0X5_HAECO
MRGRTLSPTVANWSHTPSYVQINIYNTNLEELRDRGVDLKHILKDIGCRCIVMDVPILFPIEKRCSGHLENKRVASPRHDILPPKTSETPDDVPSKIVPSDLRRKEKPRHTDKSSPSSEPNAFGDHDSIGAERPTSDALHDRVNDTDPPTGHRGVVKNYQTLEEVERSKTSSSIKVAEQPPLEAPKAFSDMIFEDILSECSEICDGLEGIGSGWPCTTDLNRSPVMNEVEGRSNIIGKESPKIYTELQAPTHASLPSNRDSVVDGGHSSWVFTVPREDCHLEAGSEEFPKSDDVPNDYNCGLDPDKTTPSSEKMKDSLRRSRTQQVLEDSQTLNCKRQENDGPTSARSDSKLKSLLKAGELSTTFECRMLGCARKLKWYPRMGRNRLVDHVRTHWKRNVKKCKLCDFKSDALRNVHRHHMSEHTDKPFMGVMSCETEDDLKELQRLYVQCFPEVVVAQFSDGMLPQFGFRSSHTRQIEAFRKRKRHSQ